MNRGSIGVGSLSLRTTSSHLVDGETATAFVAIRSSGSSVPRRLLSSEGAASRVAWPLL